MEKKMIQYLDETGNLSNGYTPTISEEQLVQGYSTMVRTRLVDERMMTLQRQGQISFAMSSLGEEGCSVASAAALTNDDWIFPQYREQGAIFWRGLSVQDYVHHMWGNAHDANKGRQMPNHFGSRALNVVTVSSPLATQIPQAAGTAYAMTLQEEPHVVLAYFGEGTTSKADFHCGLNFAATRKTPTIFFCRNNGYAISTPTTEQFATCGIIEKAKGYGIPGFRIDGNDYFAVHDTTQRAKELCLAGEGPVLIEAMTYRMGAHSSSDDPSAYREDSEVAEWKKKDPVLRLRLYLENLNIWDATKEQALRAKVTEEIDHAIEGARTAPPPSLESLIEDTYFEPTDRLRTQLSEVKSLMTEEEE